MKYAVIIGLPLTLAVLLVLAAFPPGAAVAVAYLACFWLIARRIA